MNAERLHVIALALNAEFEHSNLVRRFESMVAALEQLANQSHPQHQQNLASNLNSLYESLTNTATDKFPPAWRQVVAELGGNDLIGSTLKKEIEEILQKNQITLAVAVSQFQPILQRVTKFRDAIKQLVSSFGQLNIGKEDLKPGECEFGVLIPRDAVKNELGEFADELEEIKFIFDTMSELVSGRKEHLEIKTISSSDLTVYLELSPAVAACVAHAVERIVAIYKQLLEIRKLNGELKKQGVPKETTAGIEAHAEKVMTEGIEKISVDIINKYEKPKADKGRKNELHNGLRISLNKIANRIDKGYHIEIRCEQLAEEDAKDEKNKETSEHLAVVSTVGAQLQFFKFDGAPILQLPETTSKQKGEKF